MCLVADLSARERESGQFTEIFNKILIPSFNGDIPIVYCSPSRAPALTNYSGRNSQLSKSSQ